MADKANTSQAGRTAPAADSPAAINATKAQAQAEDYAVHGDGVLSGFTQCAWLADDFVPVDITELRIRVRASRR